MYDPHLHLMIDDRELEYRHDLIRVIERPVRLSSEPVLTPQRTWEGAGVSIWGSVYRIAGTFQMWYLGDGSGVLPNHTAMCHAVSEDGLNWVRSELTQVPVPGAATNNLFYGESGSPPVSHCHPFTVLYDPGAPAERRFRFAAYYMEEKGRPGRQRGYLIGSSADAVRWPPARRVLLPRGDRTSVMQDFKRGGYIMASRGDGHGEHQAAGLSQLRDISLSRSTDMENWEQPSRRVFGPHGDDDPAGTEFYGMPMFNWGNHYIGLLERYDKPSELLDVQLATSGDGDIWDRACSRQTWFERGPSDAWDSTWVAMAFSPPQVVGDRMLSFYTGRPVAHRRPDGGPLTSAIGVAASPRDRFAGLRAGPQGGEVSTVPVEVGGPRLSLNLGAAVGPVTVAVRREDGAALAGLDHADCPPLTTQGVDVPVAWRATDLKPLIGKKVRLQIRLCYATLFAYRFEH